MIYLIICGAVSVVMCITMGAICRTGGAAADDPPRNTQLYQAGQESTS